MRQNLDIPEDEAAYLAAAIDTVRRYPHDSRYDSVDPTSAEMQQVENLTWQIQTCRESNVIT